MKRKTKDYFIHLIFNNKEIRQYLLEKIRSKIIYYSMLVIVFCNKIKKKKKGSST